MQDNSDNSGLIQDLYDINPVIRADAAKTLGTIKTLQAEDALIGALEDKHSSVRGNAVEALGVMRSRKAVIPIIKILLSDSDRSVRRNAAQALGLIGDRRALYVLEEALDDPEYAVRSYAARALCAILGSAAEDLMIKALRKGISEASRLVVEYGMSENVIPPLIDCMGSDDPAFVGSCVDALSKIRDKRSIAPLLCLLEQSSGVGGGFSHLELSLIHAIGTLGDEDTIIHLCSMLESVPGDMRTKYLLVLKRISEHIGFSRFTETLDGAGLLTVWKTEFIKRFSVEKYGGLSPNASFDHLIANTLMESGQVVHAIPFYKNASVVTPQDPWVYKSLGDAYVLQKKYSLAIDSYSMAISKADYVLSKRGLANLHVLLGRAYEAIDKKVLAKDQYSISKEIDSSYPLSHFHMGKLFCENKPGESIIHLKRALELDPTLYDTYFYLGVAYSKDRNNAAAIDSYHQAASHITDPSLLCKVYNNLGNCLVSAGSEDEAVDAFMQIVNMGEADANCYYCLGNIYRKKEEYGKSVDYLKYALENTNQSYEKAVISNCMGLVFEKMGDLDSAEASYKSAMAHNPEYEYPYTNIANLFERKCNYKKAIAYLETAAGIVKSEKSLSSIYNNLGCIFKDKKDFDEALRYFKLSADANPQNKNPHVNAANTYSTRGDYETAIQHYCQALDIESDDAAVYVLRGNAYRFSGDLKSALEDYERAFKIKPSKELEEKIESVKRQIGSEIEVIVPEIDFCSVGGLFEVKKRIRDTVVYPLQDPGLAREYGQDVCGGVLLYGPPGCGKTYVAMAAAGEAHINFINVGMHNIKNMWYGETERKMHELFDLALDCSPCILFIDEIDAIGIKRDSGNMHAHERSKVNQLLVEMDRIDKSGRDVMVIAATNTPWDVDPALRRTGRFGTMLYVPPPDAKARSELFRIYLDKLPAIKNISYRQLARKTEGYSPSDIREICVEAARVPWKQAVKTGKKRKLNANDLWEAIKNRNSSLTPWFNLAGKQLLTDSEKTLFPELVEDIKKHQWGQDTKGYI